jgi:two-component system, NtrC family, response regulator HydG
VARGIPNGQDASTVERDQVLAPRLDLASFVVEVTRGPSRGKSLAVDASVPARVFVGKSEACQLVVDDPLVSRRHLALSLEGESLRLSDLESKNGTVVGALRVVEAFLFGGEVVTIGDSSLAIKRAGATTRARVPAAMRFGRLVGASPAMRRLYPLFERLALSDVPVILEGETGTGKELLAEAIHEASPRASEPFVVFDCTVGPSTLVEAMLFGHEKGAFTGADVSRAGVFEQAHGGTLFIDEIGDLDVRLQAKLLRAVERGEVQRLGSATWFKSDARLLAATRRDLEKEVQAGRFRDDLYYRLAVARVELPPLRRREGDVGLLAQHFWASMTREPMPADFLARLEEYAWPGNVRELHNAVAHRVALGDLANPAALRRASVPPPDEPTGATKDLVAEVIGTDLPFVQARQRVIEDFERRYVDHVLAKHDGKISKAAAASGLARRYFYSIRSRNER